MVDLIPNLLMDIIAWDNSFWGHLISIFSNFIGSFGWTIIVFTILLKIVLTPIDFFQRRNARRQAELQKEMQPEIEKVKKKYENVPDVCRQKIQEKQMEFYKRKNYNLVGGCAIMAISMLITIVVFLTLFNSLTYIGKVQTTNMYTTLANEYTRVFTETANEEKAQEAVLEMYKSGEVTQGWLWVKNVWRGDVATSPIPKYKEFIAVSQYSDKAESDNYLSEDNYLKVMQPVLDSEKGVNGYYILILLAGLVSYFSIALSSGFKNKKPKEEKSKDKVVKQGELDLDPTKKVGGIMKFVMPAIMVLFTLISNAVFALYIISNSLFALCVNPLYNKIIDKTMKNKDNHNDKGDVVVTDYRIQKKQIIKD